jgi:hypothetical protein
MRVHILAVIFGSASALAFALGAWSLSGWGAFVLAFAAFLNGILVGANVRQAIESATTTGETANDAKEREQHS